MAREMLRRTLRNVGCQWTLPLALWWPLLLGSAWPQPGVGFTGLRSAVPLLCTENHQAARTRVRGTGVIADSGGTLLTAAHVIQEARSDCTLSVMIPDDEWSRFRQLHAFLIGDCRLHLPLDLAVCRIRPAESSRDVGLCPAGPDTSAGGGAGRSGVDHRVHGVGAVAADS